MQLVSSSAALKTRDDLILSHVGLANGLARKYYRKGCGLDYEDLVQEGLVALTVAAENFLADRGDFRPFAIRSIRLSMLKAICKAHLAERTATELELANLQSPDDRDDDSAFDRLWAAVVDLPGRQKSALINRFALDGRSLSIAEFAAECGVTASTVYVWNNQAMQMLRLALSA